MIRRVAVVAGRSEVASIDEQAAAYQVGRILGEHSIGLVFDGSAHGVIATVADEIARHGGRLIGIMIKGHGPVRDDLTERRTAPDLTQWQADMVGLTEAWLGLPGGFASLAEAFAVWDWPGVRSSEQPLGLLDSGGYYSALLKSASDGDVDRFVLESQRGRLIVATSAEDLLRRLADYRPPETRRDSFFED